MLGPWPNIHLRKRANAHFDCKRQYWRPKQKSFQVFRHFIGQQTPVLWHFLGIQLVQRSSYFCRVSYQATVKSTKRQKEWSSTVDHSSLLFNFCRGLVLSTLRLSEHPYGHEPLLPARKYPFLELQHQAYCKNTITPSHNVISMLFQWAREGYYVSGVVFHRHESLTRSVAVLLNIPGLSIIPIGKTDKTNKNDKTKKW